ncbi:MAG: DUF3667 domain-containing protein [Saprospirales bacterium]|nr:MAG: DUF3667 domain-containing protein [Saprospirales bacterium]
METDQMGKQCQNCGLEAEEKAKYCPNCGQKFTSVRVGVVEMLRIFFYSLISADSTIWKSIRDFWKPGVLTRAFFSGKRKSYLHPVRLFLFSWVLFFAIFTLSGGVDLEEETNLIESKKQELQDRHHIEDLLKKRDSLKQNNESDTASIDRFILQYVETEKPTWEASSLDSLRLNVLERRDSIALGTFGGSSVKIAWDDIIQMEEEELKELYGLNEHGFLTRLLQNQLLKVVTKTYSMAEYVLMGVSWMVFLLIPTMALVLFLLYNHRSFYYIEHIVFSMHCHIFLFLSFSAIWLLDRMVNFYPGLSDEQWLSFDWLYVIAGVCSLLYLILGLRYFYKSNTLGVVIKGFVVLMAYLFLASLSLGLVLLLRFVLF